MKLTKRIRSYIIGLLSLALTYILLKYIVTYLIASSVNNILDDPTKNKVKLSNISFEPISLNLTIKDFNLDQGVILNKLYVDFNLPNLVNREVDFKALALINGAKIEADGRISSRKVDVNFTLNDFDLNIINSFIDKKKVNFGKVAGKLSSNGSFYAKNGKVNLDLSLNLQNALLYSKDLKLINYFAKELNVAKFTLIRDKSSLNLRSSSIEINNLILSIPPKELKIDKLSKFAKIRIDNVEFNSNKKDHTAKGLINFSRGGSFALNQYKADNREVTDIKVDSVNLTQFSSSFEPLLNYQIKSGKLSLDAKTFKGSKKVKGNVKINLGQLGLDNKNELGEDLKSQSLMPLRTAIFMIQDENGNIELDFDLYGNKNDPNFNVLNILGKGAGSVMISKISSIVATKVAVKFMPILISSVPLSPSNVFTFTNGVYKIVKKPRFKDVAFTASKSDIEERSKIDLVAIANFLKENKEVKLNICPMASVNEFANQKDSKNKALSLANNRVESLNKYFKKHSGGEILEQVIFCRPTISHDKEFGKATISI